ncbi:hypothetical protein GQ597_02640 [Gilliamella sp. Pra-s65]|uniref:hypothetical protein n=1 Tax=unclassified Gilliamella TaxID=2685620 RepID=UPI0013664A76|nr:MULTISPECIES: hypothetical protein [unclassified Gilliamella]MWN89608.1 hypothetical protein [Gilliamella sp. Pra-s65]MWP72616.1 hypothetical protein [Gilliamella sp. Pra-s52]
MEKTLPSVLKIVHWSLIILPGLLGASLFDYSANSCFELIHKNIILISLLLIISVLMIFFSLNLYHEDVCNFLTSSIMITVATSYIAILSPPVAYFVRGYGFYNLMAFGLFIIINMLPAILTSMSM